MNKILPTAPNFYSNQYNVTGIHLSPMGRTLSTQRHKKDIFAQQPYIACSACNLGWMKDFEDEVVKFVKPIILGTFRGRLSAAEQTTLAGWLSLIYILSELKSFSQKTITPLDREYLKINRKPPENWTILIAASNGFIWMKRRQYHNLSMYDRQAFDQIPRGLDGLPIFNTQIGTMGIGALLSQLFVCPIDAVVERYRADKQHAALKQLWPINPTRRLKFPPTIRHGDVWAETFAHDMFGRINDIAG